MQPRGLALVAALMLVWGPSPAAAAGGSIEGIVMIGGAIARPEMKPPEQLGASADPYGGRKREEEGPAERSETENVVVYISGDAGGGPYPPPSTNPTMTQHQKALVPHVLPILVGTTVDFPNRDNFNHNVFSLSNVRKFDLGLYKAGTSKSVTFDKPGQVKVYCNIHSQMRAIITVLENPYFAKPGPDGGYRIDGVPPGSYELVAWHEKFPAIFERIEVAPGRPARRDFKFE